MKKLVTSLLLLIALSFSPYLIPQTNSVELRDAGLNLLGTYSTVQAAYNAIPATIIQSYFIELLPAYNASSEIFPIVLSSRIGSGPNNIITIRPNALCVASAITGSISNSPIIRIDDADYIVIDGRPGGLGPTGVLTIENLLATGTSTNTIDFINGACFNLIQYCMTTNHTQATSGPRNIFFSTSASNISGNSDNVIYKCIITGGRSGIGSSGTTANPNKNNSVIGCEILDFGYCGIWLLGATDGFTINKNFIFQRLGMGVSSTLVFGIQTSSTIVGKIDITKNYIFDLQSTSASSTTIRGIYLVPARDAVTNVVNNMISLTMNNISISGYWGIHIAGTVPNICNILFNSFRIGGTHNAGGTTGAVVSAGIYKTGTNDTAVFVSKNNICYNDRSGPVSVVHTGFYMAAANGNLDINYNNYFAGSPTNINVNWLTTAYTNLITYKAAVAPYEVNSNFAPVFFVTPADLHLTGPSIGDFNLAGTAITGINDDIDDQVRFSTPYMGADENQIPVPVELTSFTYSLDKNNVTLRWATATETNNKGFEVQRRTTDDWTTIAFVDGNNSTTAQSNYTYLDAQLKCGTYYYRLKQTDFDGSYKYLELKEEVLVGIPEAYSLSQNYPNPFNPSTSIRYSIKNGGEVTLRVYDVLGNEVATLVKEVQEPGYYTVNFDASDLSSGIYIYSLESGEFYAIRKLLLLK